MFEVYFPVFLMLAIAIAIPVLMFVLASTLGRKNPTPEKMIPFEAGSATTGAQHLRLSVKFYLTAILFIVFDVEVVFLYPWAILFRRLGWFGFVEMMLFVVILTLGLAYVWRKGAFDWSGERQRGH